MGDTTKDNPIIIWQPQKGPQTALLTCPVFEVFFGGARGGGKTDGMLGEWVAHASQYGAKAKGLMVRRRRTELMDTIDRSRALYNPLGAKFAEQDKIWTFPDGAKLKFSYLENDKDADSYQGHAYTRVYVEEIGNFPRPEPIFKLMATLRSADGVPTGFRATGNPGGVGHSWVKDRYISPDPKGFKVIKSSFKNPFNGEIVERDRVYIPSRLSDNHFLMDNDPNYIAGLHMSGSPELVRAWLEGDWSIIAGAAFEKLSKMKHSVRPFTIPDHWTRFTSMDWGTSKPYAIAWFAVADDEVILKARDNYPERRIARGSLIMYRELYGWGGQADKGTREESWEVARKMAAMETESIDYRIADSAMWAQHDGPSAAENFMDELERLDCRPYAMEKSRKDRAANYLEFRNRFAAEDGEQPGLYIFETCEHFWRTVPELQLDEREPEKGWDTRQEDHIADCVAYGIVSRPQIWTEYARELVAYNDAREKSFKAAKKKPKGY